MANDGFNGSNAFFPTATATLGSLRGIAVSKTAAEVDVTASGDTNAAALGGIPKIEVSVDFVGGPNASQGSTGSLTIAWSDSSTLGTLSSVLCLSCEEKGNMNGEITSTAKFVPTP